MKEYNFMSRKEYDGEFKKLENLENMQQNENILSLVRLFSQTFKNICSTNYKIYALYEYPSITL
jgi:hypothetical protein